MKLKLVSEDQEVVRLACEGPISQSYAPNERDTIENLLGPDGFSRKVLLSLERSDFIDSSGIGWLVNNHRHFSKAGGMLVLHSVPPLVGQVLQFCKMDTVFHMAGTEAAARELALGEEEMKDTAPDGLRMDVSNLSPDEAVAQVIERAAALGVSDIFFSSNEDHVAISARHLGLMRRLSTVPADMGRRCIAYLKATAGMDVAEKRRPLDGRHVFRRPEQQPLDLRINTLPTLYGEDLTLRVLDRENRLLTLGHLGLLRRDYNHLIGLLNNPSGLILVTGPTGSGKTTTLYSCLAHLNNGERKINTIEDPIEYAMEGIRQSQVNIKLGVDFPDLLRSVLRQSPDVIMIGEIRDPETATTAVRAANSGHLVLATLHAPVAAGAIQSMLSLDVHPHFLASSLLGVMAQRLMRTFCPDCKQPFDITDSPQIFDEVRQWLEPGQGQVLCVPGGCPKCLKTGYRQRSGVFEVLTVTSAIRKLILAREPIQAVRRKAAEEGMISFQQAALLKVAQGETSVEEVFRAVPSEYLGAAID